METTRKFSTILALDVGSKRIGVARAHLDAPFPGPLTTLEQPDRFINDIVSLCASEKAALVVVGLPRSMNGQDTDQTRAVRNFIAELEPRLEVPVYWTDEAVTSEQAEAELRGHGKPYSKSDIDALAAVYILEDYLREHPTHG
jgi:putative Holliday junction resolvase